MRLRTKLLLAQLPLIAALILLASIALATTTTLGEASRQILSENYASVLSAQEMNESVERINEDSLRLLARHGDARPEGLAARRAAFEHALVTQEANITERGESEATARVREAWSAYAAALDGFLSTDPAARADAYFVGLQPAFVRVKARAAEILALNQDAMRRKSDAAAASARNLETIVGATTLLGCALAIAASVVLTARTLQPLALLGQTAKRIGEGDLAVRADVRGGWGGTNCGT